MTEEDNTKSQNEAKIIDTLVKSLKAVRSGNILIEIENRPSIDISARIENNINRIDIDLLNPDILGEFKRLEVEMTGKEKENELRKESSLNKIKDKLEMAKDFFHMFTDNENSIFDQLNILREFAQKLSDNNVTLVLSRKGKQAIVVGKDANPTLSRLLSGSDDLQIKSVTESSKLVGDISSEETDTK